MAAPDALDLKQLAGESEAWLQRVRDANHDIRERVLSLGHTVHYDADEDTVTINIGPPIAAASITVDDTVYFRVDPETLKVVGVKIMGWRDLVAQALFAVLMKHLMEAAPAEAVAEDVRELVLA